MQRSQNASICKALWKLCAACSLQAGRQPVCLCVCRSHLTQSAAVIWEAAPGSCCVWQRKGRLAVPISTPGLGWELWGQPAIKSGLLDTTGTGETGAVGRIRVVQRQQNANGEGNIEDAVGVAPLSDLGQTGEARRLCPTLHWLSLESFLPEATAAV